MEFSGWQGDGDTENDGIHTKYKTADARLFRIGHDIGRHGGSARKHRRNHRRAQVLIGDARHGRLTEGTGGTCGGGVSRRWGGRGRESLTWGPGKHDAGGRNAEAGRVEMSAYAMHDPAFETRRTHGVATFQRSHVTVRGSAQFAEAHRTYALCE